MQTIQQNPHYHEGFFDAREGEPLWDDAHPIYRAGWLAYWHARELLKQIKSTNEHEARPMTWDTPRPIETAPKDGTVILGHDSSGWREMWFKQDQYEGAYWTDDADSEPEPTHWLPCPPDPTN